MVVKLKDIAHRAGVSVSTASNALSGYSNLRIKKETLDRVNQVARDMGYRPNAIARSLKSQRTDTIAFYTGYGFCDVRDRFLGEIVTGIQRACDEHAIDLLLFANLSKLPEQEVFKVLTSGKVDGVIVHAAPNDPVANLLSAGTLPAVAVADRQESIPSITGNDVEGMRMLVDFLWEKGHRRIAFIYSHMPFVSVNTRRVTFEAAIVEKGGEPILFEMPWANTTQFFENLMTDPKRPTAMCCWNDDVAYYLLEVCNHMGISVPDDLALVGFDGLREGRIPGRQLVTVGVPWGKIAYEAASSLVRLRDGETIDNLREFSVTLVEGDTA